MSFRSEDEKELFIGFIEWLSEAGWLTGGGQMIRKQLVDEYIKHREQKRAWTAGISKPSN